MLDRCGRPEHAGAMRAHADAYADSAYADPIALFRDLLAMTEGLPSEEGSPA